MRVPKAVGWPLVFAWGYGVLYFLANRSIYYPFRYPKGLWNLQSQVGAQDVWLRSQDGVRLHAWWIGADDSRVVTLYLHGNGGNLTHRAGRMRDLAAAGSSVLLLDYRGYGKSEGRPSEKGLYADADAAYEHLVRAGHAPGRIVLHGESLGSAVAVDLAARRPCGGLVLEAPFSSARAVAARVLPVLGPSVIFCFDSTRKIAEVKAPLLIIHGDQDEVVPYDLGRRLFDLAPEPKTFWTVRGAGHNNLPDAAGSEYPQRLRAFYRTIR